ncbi:MAG: hypothetical protein AAF757_01630 [Cyanobacteria bacterium P01_D01_bin.116]
MLRCFFLNKFFILFTSAIVLIVGCQSQSQNSNNCATSLETSESFYLNVAQFTEELGYISLPEDAVKKVKAILKEIKV